MANVDASSSGTETVSSKENSAVRWLLLLTFVSVPLANYIIPRILTDGNQFADDPPTRVAAAGYAFAIWGVIFTGMLWFSLAMCFGKEPQTKGLRAAMICLIIAGIASIVFVPMSIYLSNTFVWVDIMAHLIPLAFRSDVSQETRCSHLIDPGIPTKMVCARLFFRPVDVLRLDHGGIGDQHVIDGGRVGDRIGRNCCDFSCDRNVGLRRSIRNRDVGKSRRCLRGNDSVGVGCGRSQTSRVSNDPLRSLGWSGGFINGELSFRRLLAGLSFIH